MSKKRDHDLEVRNQGRQQRVITIGEENVWVVTGVGLVTADLPQGNHLADIKQQGASRGCRMCMTPQNHLTDNTYDTIDNAQYTSGLRDGQVLQSEAGTSIVVAIKNGTVYFNNAQVIRANVVTKNGVIHVLDSVRWLTNSHIDAY